MRRNSWRLLLLLLCNNASRSSIINSSRFQSLLHSQQVRKPQTCRYFSSSFIITPNAQRNNLLLLASSFDSEVVRNVQNRRFFTSESDDIENKYRVRVPVFFKSTITDEMMLTWLLKKFKEDHESGRWMLFGGRRMLLDWLDYNEMSSKSYDLILGNLGSRKEYVKDFWNVVEVMRKKGHGLSKDAFVNVSENFEKEEMVSDLTRLKEWFTSPTARVCKVIIREEEEHEWDEQVVKKRLGELNIAWSSDLVEEVLVHLSMHPMKALMFFWWVVEETTPSFKHTHKTYNAMIKAAWGRGEDCVVVNDKFWLVVEQMEGAGYAMEKETYDTVMGRFYNRGMVKDAVDLYEFIMMRGPNKPLYYYHTDYLYLLQNIVVGKVLDMDLFARAIRIFTENGNSLTKTLFYGVLECLDMCRRLQECGMVLKATEKGVFVADSDVECLDIGRRLQECGKVLKAMEKGGFVADSDVHIQVIFQLSLAGKVDECYDILKEIETSGSDPNFNETWESMIHGLCDAVNVVDAASTCFRKMVEKNGVANAGYPFDLLVNAFCEKKRAGDAFKFLSEMVKATELQPRLRTYQMLIQALLVGRNLKEALSLLELMKNHGFPPFLNPFIYYISKSGTGDDAISFLEAVSAKDCPSTTSLFIGMFKAFFKRGRQNEAHDCLSKCPGYIRSHADVLNLFLEMKPEETAAAVSA